jgi:hypothetical protein
MFAPGRRAQGGHERELRVGDDVGPRPARQVHAQQDVGPATPAALDERRLGDDAHAAGHRGARLVHARVIEGDPFEPDDLDPALRPQVLQVGALVREAALAQHVAQGILPARRRDAALREQPLERGQVATAEVAGEVRGGDQQAGFGEAHREP